MYFTITEKEYYRIFRILSSGVLHRICATTREHSFLRILPA